MIQTIETMPAKTVAAADADQIVNAMILAFSTDPAVRWMYPNPTQYLKNFPEFVRAFGGQAFEHQTAYSVDGYAGGALWLPPDVSPDYDGLIELLQRTVSEQDQEEIFAVFEQMGQYHPSEPHWYLPLIGVEPTQQGKGYGSALMKSALVRCDRDHQMAYLESSNSANIPFYERHGFELLDKIQLELSPPIFPMVRHPQSS